MGTKATVGPDRAKASRAMPRSKVMISLQGEKNEQVGYIILDRKTLLIQLRSIRKHESENLCPIPATFDHFYKPNPNKDK